MQKKDEKINEFVILTATTFIIAEGFYFWKNRKI